MLILPKALRRKRSVTAKSSAGKQLSQSPHAPGELWIIRQEKRSHGQTREQPSSCSASGSSCIICQHLLGLFSASRGAEQETQG